MNVIHYTTSWRCQWYFENSINRQRFRIRDRVPDTWFQPSSYDVAPELPQLTRPR
jgi:hypothetical protein